MSDRPFRISSPCDQDWDLMFGNDRIRFCSHCEKSVHHVSTMSRKQIKKLVTKSKGQLCVRLSNVTTQPVVSSPLYKIGKRTSIIAASAFSASLSISSAIAGTVPKQSKDPSRTERVHSHSLTRLLLRSETGALHGVVFDPNGALLPDVTVTLTNSETRQIVSALSDGEGAYRFTNVEVGTYSIKFEANGFAAAQASMITIHANDDNRLDQTLSIATINEVVEIIASSTMGVVMIVEPGDPLVKAAMADDLNGLKTALLKEDANTRDAGTDWTALECAVRNGNREMVQTLLQSNADVNARDRSGQTVLMMIDEDVTSDLVWDLLNAGAKTNARDKDGDTALTEIAGTKNTEVLRTLLEAGAKVNAVNNEGETALMRAAAEGLVNNVRVLIQFGAEVNQRDKKGRTALMRAKEEGHRPVMRLLIAFGGLEFELPEEP
jgi:hypothetical protein